MLHLRSSDPKRLMGVTPINWRNILGRCHYNPVVVKSVASHDKIDDDKCLNHQRINSPKNINLKFVINNC